MKHNELIKKQRVHLNIVACFFFLLTLIFLVSLMDEIVLTITLGFTADSVCIMNAHD